uniref:SET domain-containing protein n=1 Tax=Lepeophtheirus salmonis TaxID=72036 RepID=A0A0K2VGB1_LEPSM
MLLSFGIIFLSLFMRIPTTEGTRYGYLSACDLISPSKTWHKNTGYELISWVESIIPHPLAKSDDAILAGFVSSDYYVNVNEVYSPKGISWKRYGSKRFDGWLYGVTDSHRKFVPGRTYFIFPDYKTAYVGTFKDDDVMLEGRAVKITHFRCNSGVMELKFTKPKKDCTVYKSIYRTNTYYSATPHERDPMEKRNIYIGSSVNVPAIANQDAIFARRDIPAHSIVSYYSGVWETYDLPFFTPNMTEMEKQDKHKNLLSFNDTHSIDVTPHMSDIRNYLSTLGHKSNNHFINDNVIFCLVKHPVYGEIRCLESKKPIERGEEILINYGYNVHENDSPQWYKDMYFSLFPHEQNQTMSLIENYQ